MNFIWRITASRALRQKTRLLFVLLAIAASSCLVVWTIGGFQALFIDNSVKDEAILGEYDLRVAAEVSNVGLGGARNVNPTFGAPFSAKEDANSGAKKKDPVNELTPSSNASDAKNADAKNADAWKKGTRGDAKAAEKALEQENRRSERKGGTQKGDPRRRRGPQGLGAPSVVFSEELTSSLRADKAVAICDETATLRMFVYSPGSPASILEDADAEDEGLKPTLKRSLGITDEELAAIGEAPEGVDPELHRRAFGAYRAMMGTPMGMGSTFLATTAVNAPYELKEGRWFHYKNADGSVPREAVMTVKGNEKYRAKIGDPLLLIDKPSLIGATNEYQLVVVGIVNDSENDGFYISRALADEISKSAPPVADALYLKIRGDADEFRARWSERLSEAGPNVKAVTGQEIAERRAAMFRENQSFKYQAVSGATLAALAALLIVFTALNMSVDEEKRLIAFYRVSGLTRSQVGFSILLEAALLALPGWLAGMGTGWLLVLICSGKATGLNTATVLYSFFCTFVGGILAAAYPIFQSARVKPLDAIGAPEKRFLTGKRRRRQTVSFIIAAILGAIAILADLYIVYHLPGDDAKRAALHSGGGVLLLAFGVVCLLPLTIRVAELVLLPILAWILRFDPRSLRRELSGNASRVAAVSVALSVGGGLFVTMQIWGYSMLDMFLPDRTSPEAFAAFLPNGLRPEIVGELRALPCVDPDRFLPIAVEQAALSSDSVKIDPRKSQFANVVFFGVDVDKAFRGKDPMVGARFRKGDAKKAFDAIKKGRGVIVTQSLTVDYGLDLGDALKVVHPRDPEKTLEYPIVGVITFPGWQWLSKTGGVRRNFGRSGALVFASEETIADDYQIDRRSYFWFDPKKGQKIDYYETEAACDYLARKNLTLDRKEGVAANDVSGAAQTAYVKLSTTESLTDSIVSRADKVIWGLAKTPLTTLAIAAIAVVGAIANSVRSRRWVYGVMRALGYTRWTIVRAILAESILIGVVASFASFTFGFLAAHGALKLGQSVFGSADPPLILPVKGLLVGFGLTVALCLLAALYPAIKTGRTETLKLIKGGRSLE